MNHTKRPPDYSKFSIDDCEKLYATLSAGLVSIDTAMHQHRGSEARLGANVAQSFSTTLDQAMADLIGHVRSTRFNRLDLESRRRVLLIRYELDFGDGDLRQIADLADIAA